VLSTAMLTLALVLAAFVWRFLGLDVYGPFGVWQYCAQAVMGVVFVIEAALALGWLRRQARLARTEGVLS
jgi:hypothetical protein